MLDVKSACALASSFASINWGQNSGRLNTDRGSTYSSQRYRDLLQANGMQSSMSRKKDCWDNAVAESFFSTVKNELVWGNNYADRQQARSAIFEFIEVFYNRQRLHETLGYRTPLQVDQAAAVRVG
ncbi:transposase [Abyssibacter sp.]|jgi:transposase InsO family protein|uniref:transposase n=1 Tax=Abyssibacter sp. TaxID=2320200 RepID=UPI003519D434